VSADDRPRSAPRCPRCGSTEAQVISLFGAQAITLQYRCAACGCLYEAVRYEATEGSEGSEESGASPQA
jgi:hypothetical protein